jgi:hypothetical protein
MINFESSRHFPINNPTTREINKKTAMMSAMDLDAPVSIAPQARDQHNNAT